MSTEIVYDTGFPIRNERYTDPETYLLNKLDQSLEVIKGLSEDERLDVVNRLEQLSEILNIPLLSSPEIRQVKHTDNKITVSNVGATILGWKKGDRQIYTQGVPPFAGFFITRDQAGEVQIDLEGALWYRHVGHDPVPNQNAHVGIEEGVAERIEHLTGKKLPEDFDSFHHGINQTRLYDLNIEQAVPGIPLIQIGGEITADKANLFRLHYFKEVYFEADADGNEWMVEATEISNFDTTDAIITHLRHAYINIPSHGDMTAEEVFANSKIYKASNRNGQQDKELLMDLANYQEAEFPFPDQDEWLILQRGDGVEMHIRFEGDYHKTHSQLQVFSNASSAEHYTTDLHKAFQSDLTRMNTVSNSIRHWELKQMD